MGLRTGRGILALGLLSFGLGLAPVGARAQLFGGPAVPPSGGAAMLGASSANTTMGGGAMGMYGNPYMNPMTNPYMNPFLMSQASGTSSGNPALYLFAAQQMNGGMLSGRIGGPNAGKSATKPAVTTPADAARGTGANTPGGMASRYFSRSTPANPGTARYYGRQSRYYPNNGR